jgi:erythrocyte band 7 integral membrane protein
MVERVEVKDVRLPVQLQRAMATEAEATREARAKVVAAQGEQNASVALKAAADTINKCPIALQLRYLQTLTHIAGEKNSTIVFPIPIEFLKLISGKNERHAQKQEQYQQQQQQQSHHHYSSGKADHDKDED